MGALRLRHKDKNAKCRFFEVPADGPALLGMPDIKVLNIPKIMRRVISDTHESRMLYLQRIEASNSPICRTNKASQNKTEKVDAHENNVNMPDYFRSSMNRVADIRDQARY